MKKIILGAIALLMTVGAYAQVKPQPTTLPVNVGVELSDMINVTKISDVYFGGVYIPTSSDVTVKMDKTGLVSVASGTTTLYNQVSQRLGQIRIVANSEADFNLAAPATVNLKIAAGATDEGEQIPDLVYTPTFFDMAGNKIDLTTTKYDFDESVYGTIGIGGSLVVPASAYRGVYSGVMNVTVSWL